MAFPVAALLVVAKALLLVLAGVLLLAILLLVLPVGAAVQGECRVEGDLDELPEIGETEAGDGGSGEACPPDVPEAVIAITPAGTARLTVLGGLLGAEYQSGGSLRVLVAGVRVGGSRSPAKRARPRPEPPEGQEAVVPEGSQPAKSKEKTGFLKAMKAGRAGKALEALKPGRFLRKKGPDERAQTRRGFSLKVKADEVGRWLSPKVRRIVLTTAKRLVKASHLKGRVHVECGLGDPGATGMAYAAFVTWSGMTRQEWMTLEPNFVDSVIFARVQGETWFLPAQVAYILGRFLLSRDIRPLWRRRAGESRKAPVLGAHISG
ncbi:MAG TPA: hypothetical protein GX512_01200 [Firmicutes bacterium]|nr:hypothetical protein [Candidatus Fermentithermobacillaceae bacterium]